MNDPQGNGKICVCDISNFTCIQIRELTAKEAFWSKLKKFDNVKKPWSLSKQKV